MTQAAAIRPDPYRPVRILGAGPGAVVNETIRLVERDGFSIGNVIDPGVEGTDPHRLVPVFENRARHVFRQTVINGKHLDDTILETDQTSRIRSDPEISLRVFV